MNVLLIGGGAREHAIAWKLRQSPRLAALYAAPGNAGIGALAETRPLAIPKPGATGTDVDVFLADAVSLARKCKADLVVVGPEDPLGFGLVDRLAVEGIATFGPTRAAAQIEASKSFAKDLLGRNGIATAASARFDDFAEARRYIESRGGPVVVKADGFAAGKGVTVADSPEQAIEAARSLLVGRALGDVGRTIVVEDRLSGRETSAHAFSDGAHVAHMPFACDHKPAYDGDRGPNTGGMGAYSPASWLDAATEDAIRRDVTERTLAALAAEGRPFSGVLYPGLMITPDGPRVIEFNCRFGDPEAEVLLPRLESDLFEIMLAVAHGTLDRADVRWSDRAAVSVMLVSGGYPGGYETGIPIEGLTDVEEDVLIFHAGTRRDASGRIVTAGGRVLAVTAVAATLAEAREAAYRNITRISFTGMHYRTDIGATAVAAAV